MYRCPVCHEYILLCLIRQKVEAGPTGCTVLGQKAEENILLFLPLLSKRCSRDRKGIG